MSAYQRALVPFGAIFRSTYSNGPRFTLLAQVQRRAMSTVKTENQNGVFLVSINRPEKRNCVNHETAKALLYAFETFNKTPELKVAVLYGEGDHFCAGYDLQDVSEGKHHRVDKEFVEFVSKHRFMGPTNMHLKKPVIAAIEGFAVAGGLELALMADLRVVSESAVLGVFCRRVGVPLIDGGTVRLPKVIGLGRALDLILTGRDVSAAEAKHYGLANRLVKKGQALSESIELARLIMKNPELCMLTDRESVYHSLNVSAKKAMEFEYENGTGILDEAIKGARKFTQKKKSKL